tara:strand:- start:7023 stop:8318 length:1296 start_codon:yes stop_codon:yes gene_type:complete
MLNESPEKIIELRSEDVQEILSTPPVWIVRWGITLILIFTLIILTLSSIIRYPDIVSSRVVVTTEKPTERIIARNSGQLDKMLVKDRDKVGINQKLAVLKNTANYKDVYILKNMVDSIEQIRGDFSFPIEKTSDLILGDIEVSYINFEKSYVEYYLFKDLNLYENRLRGNKISLKEIRMQVTNQIKQKQLLEKENELKKMDYKRHQQLYDKGVISRQKMESKELEFLQIQKNINTMAISISQMREAISSANQTLESTQINRKEENTRYFSKLVRDFNSLKNEINDWEYNYVLSSSINGVVSFQEYWGENQHVTIGDVVFSILPQDTSNLVGKLAIPSQNSGKVLIGQKVIVKLDNYSYQQYGSLNGVVRNLSITPDKNRNYIVYISLPEGTRTSHGKTLGFEQELLGNAEIITEDLSIADRIFYKFKNILE